MMSKYRKQFEREVLEDEQIKQILEEVRLINNDLGRYLMVIWG